MGLTLDLASCRKDWMTRLVDVPTTELRPPNMALYDRGIKKVDGLSSLSLAQSLMRGMRSATMGVLFRNVDRIKTMIVCLSKATLGGCLAPRIYLLNLTINWLSDTDLITTNSATTVMSPGLLNPARASLVVKTVVIHKIVLAHRIKSQAGCFSKHKAIKVISITTDVQ